MSLTVIQKEGWRNSYVYIGIGELLLGIFGFIIVREPKKDASKVEEDKKKK